MVKGFSFKLLNFFVLLNRQYGLGVDVLRWWVASKHSFENQFITINEKDFEERNSEINMIRKCFYEIN